MPRSKDFIRTLSFRVTYLILFSNLCVSRAIVFQRLSESRVGSGENLVDQLPESQLALPYLDRPDSREQFSEGGRIFKEDLRYDPYENYGLTNGHEEPENRDKWQGWNYLEKLKPWTPHEKTVSLQVFDDDGRYAHAPPAWPHDEYLTQFSPSYHPGLKNGTEPPTVTGGSDATNIHEWQKLRPKPYHNMFIGPGFYDSTYAYPQQTHQAITDSVAASVVSANDGGEGQIIPNAVSESNSHGKFYQGAGGSGWISPHDYYRRKRLRLKIHPGLIAAPIAALAAYKSVSAIASKPLLFELGWVGNKPQVAVGGGGWGWPQPRPPYHYPVHVPVPVHPVPAHPIHIIGGETQFPILRPRRKPEYQKSSSSSWWNPFAALTPRFLNGKNDRSCCDDDASTTKMNANTITEDFQNFIP